MKCLTIQQPWAGLILAGVKDVENRKWSTPHRGLMLIHAGRSIDHRACKLSQVIAHDGPLGKPLGVILGVVELYDIVEGEQCQLPWANGSRYAWLLRKPRIFRRPIPYRGALGLYEVPDAQVRTSVANALTPNQWRTWKEQVRAKQVNPRERASQDGWTGD